MLKEGKINNTNITLQIVKDKKAIAQHFAQTMVDAVKENNKTNKPTRFIMPVGPTGQYRIFVDTCNKNRIDLSMLHIFFMDEYVRDDKKNLSVSHPFSFSHFLKKNFFDLFDTGCSLKDEQMHIPNACSPADHTEAIEKAGGIDICFGGIGINGHMAFNEALDNTELINNEDFKKLPTRVVKIATTTKVINSVFGTGGNMEAIPDFAVTVGMKEILASRKIHMYLDWPWQKQALRNTLFGPITPTFPASFLQTHPNVTITVAEYVAQEPSLMPE